MNDLDLLSAYLDNALDAQARAALEARLATDPALAQTLGDLRATRLLVRALPTLRAPRAFTLTEAQARQARRPRVLAVVWGSVSAAAAALLVVVAGVLLLGDTSRDAPAARLRDVQVAAAPTMVVTAALAVPTVIEMLPEMGVGAAFESANDVLDAATAEAPEDEAMADEAQEAAPAPAMPFSAPAPGEADAALSQQAPAAAQRRARVTAEPSPTATVTPSATPTATHTPAASPTALPPVVAPPEVSARRWGLAGALLAGALGLGVLAWVLYRWARR